MSRICAIARTRAIATSIRIRTMGTTTTISIAGVASRSYRPGEGAGDLITSRIALGGTLCLDMRDTPQAMPLVGTRLGMVGMRPGMVGTHPGMADMGMGDTQVSPAA